MPKNKELMTPKEVSEVLNVSVDKVLEMARDGMLRSIVLGPRTTRIFRSAVEAMMLGAEL